MILPYIEIKEAVYDSYISLHENSGYPIQDTLFATIGDYDFSDEYGQTDECCIYINFAIILINKNKNFDFMKGKLIELLDDRQIDLFKSDLGNEFHEFLNDVNIVKCHL